MVADIHTIQKKRQAQHNKSNLRDSQSGLGSDHRRRANIGGHTVLSQQVDLDGLATDIRRWCQIIDGLAGQSGQRELKNGELLGGR